MFRSINLNKFCRCTATDYVRHSGTQISFPKDGQSWLILSDIEQRIKAKIEKVGVPLKNWNIKIYRGILTGCNEAFIISKEKRDELIKKSANSADIIRPILRGRDIKRYSYDFADLYLIATFPSKKYNIDDYPAVRDYLLEYGKEKLEQSGKPNARKKTNNKWFETQDTIAYWEDFSKQKIIFQEIVQESSFGLDDDGKFFCLDTGRIIVGKDTDFLITIFNSKLFFFAIKNFYGGGKLGDSGVRMKHTFFLDFCCPKLNTMQKTPFLGLLNSLMKSSGVDEQLNIVNKIDALVYKLYELSDEEISFIETQ